MGRERTAPVMRPAGLGRMGLLMLRIRCQDLMGVGRDRVWTEKWPFVNAIG